MLIRPEDSFDAERTMLFPNAGNAEDVQSPLIERTLPVEMGYYAVARHHFRERPSGEPNWILVHCIAGSGTVGIDDQIYTLSANQVICLPPNAAHFYGASQNDPWSILWCHFSAGGAYATMVARPTREILSSGRQQLVKKRWTEFFDLCSKTYQFENAVCASNLLRLLLSEIYLLPDQQSPNMENARLEIAIRHIKHHLSERKTLCQLADDLGTSRSALSELFHRAYQTGPIEYMIQLRIDKACELLRFSTLRIYEVATELGYSDPLYFSRQFKQIVGVSPKQYRLTSSRIGR